MAMTAAERKQKQRSTEAGYAKEREMSWRRQGIYNFSYQDYKEMLRVQNHMCGICGTHINGNSALDHDHKTGKVRGLLCTPCNIALGLLENAGNVQEFATNATSYLRFTREEEIR